MENGNKSADQTSDAAVTNESNPATPAKPDLAAIADALEATTPKPDSQPVTEAANKPKGGKGGKAKGGKGKGGKPATPAPNKGGKGPMKSPANRQMTADKQAPSRGGVVTRDLKGESLKTANSLKEAAEIVKGGFPKKSPGKDEPVKKAGAVPRDQFGFREGSLKSKAAAMYASPKGATLAEVKASTGSNQLNLLTELAKVDFTIDRKKEPGTGKKQVTRYFLKRKSAAKPKTPTKTAKNKNPAVTAKPAASKVEAAAARLN